MGSIKSYEDFFWGRRAKNMHKLINPIVGVVVYPLSGFPSLEAGMIIPNIRS